MWIWRVWRLGTVTSLVSACNTFCSQYSTLSIKLSGLPEGLSGLLTNLAASFLAVTTRCIASTKILAFSVSEKESILAWSLRCYWRQDTRTPFIKCLWSVDSASGDLGSESGHASLYKECKPCSNMAMLSPFSCFQWSNIWQNLALSTCKPKFIIASAMLDLELLLEHLEHVVACDGWRDQRLATLYPNGNIDTSTRVLETAWTIDTGGVCCMVPACITKHCWMWFKMVDGNVDCNGLDLGSGGGGQKLPPDGLLWAKFWVGIATCIDLVISVSAWKVFLSVWESILYLWNASASRPCRLHINSPIYTVIHKKRVTFICSITLANIDGFS